MVALFKMVASKRRRIHTNPSTEITSSPSSRIIIEELQNKESIAKDKYLLLLNELQELIACILKLGIIVKNIMITVPRMAILLQARMDQREAINKLIPPECDYHMINMANSTVDELRIKIDKIDQESNQLSEHIQLLLVRRKNAHNVIKTLMYAHFSIKMPQKKTFVPF